MQINEDPSWQEAIIDYLVNGNVPADKSKARKVYPWPFMQWAIDLVVLLPPAPAKKDMMIVATDYFTKWIEAEALSSTKEANVERFIRRKIICRFGSTRNRWIPIMVYNSLASRSTPSLQNTRSSNTCLPQVLIRTPTR
ncbi:unnamed protein product [Prunus brigantina]